MEVDTNNNREIQWWKVSRSKRGAVFWGNSCLISNLDVGDPLFYIGILPGRLKNICHIELNIQSALIILEKMKKPIGKTGTVGNER